MRTAPPQKRTREDRSPVDPRLSEEYVSEEESVQEEAEEKEEEKEAFGTDEEYGCSAVQGYSPWLERVAPGSEMIDLRNYAYACAMAHTEDLTRTQESYETLSEPLEKSAIVSVAMGGLVCLAATVDAMLRRPITAPISRVSVAVPVAIPALGSIASLCFLFAARKCTKLRQEVTAHSTARESWLNLFTQSTNLLHKVLDEPVFGPGDFDAELAILMDDALKLHSTTVEPECIADVNSPLVRSFHTHDVQYWANMFRHTSN